MNPWGIALASHSLPDLFAKLHYEGHACLWYALLWLASRLTRSYLAMKFIQGAITAATIALIGLCSPFSRSERAAILCSYYFLFEYAVITRTYGLCLLVFLLYVLNRFRHPERVKTNAALLALLANTDLLGLMLGLVLFCEYACQQRQNLKQATLIYAAGIALCCAVTSPARDISLRMHAHLLAHLHQPGVLLGAAVVNIVHPWLAVKFTYPQPYWDPWVGDSTLYLALPPFILAAYWFVLSSHKRLLLVVAATIVGSTLFCFLIYFGSVRNWGIVFLAFLFALWAIRASGRPVPRVALGLLLVSDAAGLAASLADYHHPFSNARFAAEWLKTNHLDNAQLIGAPDTSAAAVAEYLDKPIYFLDCYCSDTYLLFSSRRDSFKEEQISARAAEAFHRLPHSRPLILILVDPLKPEAKAHLNANELARFTGSEAWQEDFYLYALPDNPRDLPPRNKS